MIFNLLLFSSSINEFILSGKRSTKVVSFHIISGESFNPMYLSFHYRLLLSLFQSVTNALLQDLSSRWIPPFSLSLQLPIFSSVHKTKQKALTRLTHDLYLYTESLDSILSFP